METRMLVIGGGPGGYVAAIRAAQLGASVTLVEKRWLGGTCLNCGCIPSKLMKSSADLFSHIQAGAASGIALSGTVHPDLSALQAHKHQVIKTQMSGIRQLLDHHRITLVYGQATLIRSGVCRVVTADGSVSEICWDKLIIAAGSVPLPLPDIPFDGHRILSSTHALALESVPASMAIIGAGVVGCEFASIFQALGTQITLIEKQDTLLPLPGMDTGVIKTLTREMKKRKITLFTGTTVAACDRSDESVTLRLHKTGTEKAETLDAQHLLVSIGRLPATDGLDAGCIGLETDERGWIIVDETMKTSVDGVYAIGDITGPSRHMLAHVASAEGDIAAANAMGANQTMDYSAVPGCVFSTPEIGYAGHTLETAERAGIRASAETVFFRTIGKAHVIGAISGQATLVRETESDRVIGVHIIGPQAAELIAEGVVAIRNRLTVKAIMNTLHAHPTLSEIMGETAMKLSGRPLHG